MQLPSPPQRRLSRSSIDLRDLEQQSHEKVPHTDSAPSIIITDHFTFDGKQHHCGKSTNSLQHLLKDELLLQPLAATSTPAHQHHHHHQLLQLSKRTDLEILRDNDQLARFIEDNFCYFKKQNSTPADELRRNVNGGSGNDYSNISAMSESDFEFFRRQTVMTDDKSNVKQNDENQRQRHLSACSDSDFMVTAGKRRQRSRVLSSVKSPIGYAKSMFAGRGTSTLPQPDVPPNNTRQLQSRHQRGKRNVLSRSCNECYEKKSIASAEVTDDVRALQRVLSEGGNTKNTNETCAARQMAIKQQKQQWTTVDMFLQLICDSSKKSDDKATSPLPPKRDNTCTEQLLILNMNTHCDLKKNSLNDFSMLSGNASSNNSAPPTAKFYEQISKSDQQVIVNRSAMDDISPNNLRDNRTKSEHIFVNSVVVNESSSAPKAIFTFSPDEAPYAMGTPPTFSNNIPTVALVPPVSPNNLLATPSDLCINTNTNNNNHSLVIPNEHALDSRTNNGSNLMKKEKNRGHISVVTYAVSVTGSTNDMDLGDGGETTTYGSTGRHFNPNQYDQRGRPSTSSTSK